MLNVLPKLLFHSHQSNEEWVEETVTFFREIGFFEEWKRLKTATIIQKLENLGARKAYAFISADQSMLSDLSLVMWDMRRIWVVDPDALVLQGNEVYVQSLQELASISQKKFNPTNIEEIWEGEEGPIIVRFVVKKQTYSLKPRFLETYIDYGIIRELNDIVREDGYQFEVCENGGEDPVVLFLSPDEKEILKQKRGWKFTHKDDL